MSDTYQKHSKGWHLPSAEEVLKLIMSSDLNPFDGIDSGTGLDESQVQAKNSIQKVAYKVGDGFIDTGFIGTEFLPLRVDSDAKSDAALMAGARVAIKYGDNGLPIKVKIGFEGSKKNDWTAETKGPEQTLNLDKDYAHVLAMMDGLQKWVKEQGGDKIDVDIHGYSRGGAAVNAFAKHLAEHPDFTNQFGDMQLSAGASSPIYTSDDLPDNVMLYNWAFPVDDVPGAIEKFSAYLPDEGFQAKLESSELMADVQEAAKDFSQPLGELSSNSQFIGRVVEVLCEESRTPLINLVNEVGDLPTPDNVNIDIFDRDYAAHLISTTPGTRRMPDPDSPWAIHVDAMKAVSHHYKPANAYIVEHDKHHWVDHATDGRLNYFDDFWDFRDSGVAIDIPQPRAHSDQVPSDQVDPVELVGQSWQEDDLPFIA